MSYPKAMLPIRTYHFESLDSTNLWAKERAFSFEKGALSVVVADYQTKGKGQFGRAWVSEKGDLFVSFVFYVSKNWDQIPRAAQLLCLSAADVLMRYGLIVKMKLPNDLKVDGKKIAGALCEVVNGEDHSVLIDGIGLNVQAKDLLKLEKPATSILLETEQEMAVDRVLLDLTVQFNNDLALFLKEGFEPFISRFDSLQIRNNT